jgi:rubrerythrin
MGDDLRRALDLAAERARAAETFYKDWAKRAEDPAARILFGELGAAEHNHWQALEHITPADLVARRRADAAAVAMAGVRVRRTVRHAVSLAEAIGIALEGEAAAQGLYERLAKLEGEAAALFRALAAEAAAHAGKLAALRSAGGETGCASAG